MLVSNRTDLAEPPVARPTSAGQRLVAAWRNGPGAGIDITVHADLDEIAPTWRAFEAVAEGTVFQTYAWHETWHRTVGRARGVTPAIVVGRRGEAVVFLAPLAVERRLVARLVWHAGDMSDYNAPLVAADFAEILPPASFAAFFRRVREAIAAAAPFDVVSLDKMPGTVAAAANPFAAIATQKAPDGAWRMALSGDWEAFYRDKRSSATRRKDRKKRAKLATFGEVRFESAREPGDVMAHLEELFRQKTAWLAAVGAPDFFGRPGHRDFFTALAREPRSRGAVHLGRLMVGEATAATAFAMIHRGAYYLLVLAYAQGPLTPWGPGAALLRDLIAYAIDAGCTVFDFTIGDERFKSEWCEAAAPLWMTSTAVTWKGIPVIAAEQAVAGAKRFIKQNAFLRAAAMKTRTRVLHRAPAGEAPRESGEDDDAS